VRQRRGAECARVDVPTQQFIQLVHQALVSVEGLTRLWPSRSGPHGDLMAGLQGPGKTTATAKLVSPQGTGARALMCRRRVPPRPIDQLTHPVSRSTVEIQLGTRETEEILAAGVGQRARPEASTCGWLTRPGRLADRLPG